MEAGDDPDAKASQPGWSQPLRLHLSVVIVTLLLGISLPSPKLA
jgi:hypothetical protein